MISLILAFIALSTLMYYYLVWNFDCWHRRNVRGPRPQALFGTYPSLLRRNQHFGDDLRDIYMRYKTTDNFVGTFLMRTPQLMILDPQIVHDIFVTAFNHFEDNDVAKLIDKNKDPLIAKNPFILTGNEWRKERSLLSPVLTSCRIKHSYESMVNVCKDMVTFIGQQGLLNINAKDLSLRYTTDSLGECVLGLKPHSFTPTPIPIVENVKKFAEQNVAFTLFAIIVGLVPNILKFFHAKFFPKDCEVFFMELMKQALRIPNRGLKFQNHTDIGVLSHLLRMKDMHDLKDIELYSHTMTFLIDGLDTTATVISHCLLMLALEPIVQQRLHLEILEACNGNNQIPFDKLNEMPYLDACIHESLRIYPPGLWSTKCCTKPYELRNKNGQMIKIEKGDSVIIPIYGLHHDPEYYSEPEVFKPERFLPDNGGVKRYRDHGVFLGFGNGPRTCLGMRFALIQCKASVTSLVKSFNIRTNAQTKCQFKLDPKCFLALHYGGVWLDFQKR